MIAAVIAMCLAAAPGQCESHQVRVEARACRVAPIRAQAPISGEWRPVIVSIRCGRR